MGLKVGVTTVGRPQGGEAALWSNGAAQNVVFLALLLAGLPQVELSALICTPDGAGECPLGPAFGLPQIDMIDAVERLDVIVELGVRGEGELMARFRGRGGRLISYMAGNTMAMNFEALACGLPHGEMLADSGFDAVWITPQHWRMNRGYCALTRSPVVRQVPHVWSPVVLRRAAAQAGVAFRCTPPADGAWRIGVFDPNINVLKTFHLPLLVCEEGWRRAPHRIARVLLFGAAHLIGTPHFDELCGVLDISRAGRLFAEPRLPLVQVLGVHVDAVVTHQWENALNYLYYDALFGGFPLIHNAPALGAAGFAYPDFDPQAGGAALALALEAHLWPDPLRREAEREVLFEHDIDNPAVRAAYAERLEEAMCLA